MFLWQGLALYENITSNKNIFRSVWREAIRPLKCWVGASARGVKSIESVHTKRIRSEGQKKKAEP